ncbi:MAG: hypothetical protein ACK6EB_42775, partial [Planctomyces sp.]
AQPERTVTVRIPISPIHRKDMCRGRDRVRRMVRGGRRRRPVRQRGTGAGKKKPAPSGAG